MKLTIYYGASKPAVAVGVNQCHALEFCQRYAGWHSYKTDRATLRALKGLERRGHIEINQETKQFRFKRHEPTPIHP